jgi:hypothetical protein
MIFIVDDDFFSSIPIVSISTWLVQIISAQDLSVLYDSYDLFTQTRFMFF